MRRIFYGIAVALVLVFGGVSYNIGVNEGEKGKKIVEVRVPPVEYPQTTTTQYEPQVLTPLTEAATSQYIQQFFEQIVSTKYGAEQNWTVTSTSYTVFPSAVSYRIVHTELDGQKQELIISRNVYFKYFTVEFNMPESNAAGIDRYACFGFVGDSYISCEFVERLK